MSTNVRPESMERITNEKLALAFIEEQVAEIRAQVGDKKVLLALSGGVDSSVVAALLIKAIGKQLVCVHVNHGLMRKGESEQVVDIFGKELDANLVYIDAGYLCSVALLTALNVCTPWHASGHGCSIGGSIILPCLFLGGYAILPGLLLFGLVFWASVYLKRHTPGEFLLGALCALISAVCGYFLLHPAF